MAFESPNGACWRDSSYSFSISYKNTHDNRPTFRHRPLSPEPKSITPFTAYVDRHCELQYKLCYTISNNIEIYEEPIPSTKKIPPCVVKFEIGEENRIVQENVYCLYTF